MMKKNILCYEKKKLFCWYLVLMLKIMSSDKNSLYLNIYIIFIERKIKLVPKNFPNFFSSSSSNFASPLIDYHEKFLCELLENY